jgi:formamidopyrimidine-DNA glycosylase
MLETAEAPKVEVAFTDARRFSRVRLVDCPAGAIRKTTPLKENGPDPVIDKGVLTEEWLAKKLKSKHVPLKALLLDQAVISGIGNWVGCVCLSAPNLYLYNLWMIITNIASDEILYHSRLHPEQYSDTFSTAQMLRLHASIMHICDTAVSTLADSEQFPADWLFKHRWGKGKKDTATKMPDGSAITFLTVGGRTSCVVPSRQKKTGAVAADMQEAKPEAAKAVGRKGAAKGRPAKASDEPEGDVNGASSAADSDDSDSAPPPPSKKRKAPQPKPASGRDKKAKPNGTASAAAAEAEGQDADEGDDEAGGGNAPAPLSQKKPMPPPRAVKPSAATTSQVGSRPATEAKALPTAGAGGRTPIRRSGHAPRG